MQEINQSSLRFCDQVNHLKHNIKHQESLQKLCLDKKQRSQSSSSTVQFTQNIDQEFDFSKKRSAQPIPTGISAK